MVDYYSELGLDKSKKLDEINSELNRLESTWKRREITNPEKATTMLALIIQARKVFSSDSSRSAYDDKLSRDNKGPEVTDPDKARTEEINKWKSQAKSYDDSRQFDLAKVAVEKAISMSNANGDDDSLFALATEIYIHNGDLDLAMTYINRAIVTAPNVSSHYFMKGIIYDQQASSTNYRYGNGGNVDYRTESRKMFQMADSKAEQSGDRSSRARACGALALSYYFQNPIDKDKGEHFANLAVSYGGDPWGNADRVLSDIRDKREAAENAERERSRIQEENRKNKIYDEAIHLASSENVDELEMAVAKFNDISGWKDSIRQAELCRNKVTTIKETELKRKKRNKRIAKVIIALGSVGIVFAVIFGVITNIQHHKCGDNVRWKLEGDTLRIYGKGAMYDYNNIRTPWGNIPAYSIKTIRIENGVTTVGAYAFHSYSFCRVTNIILPDTLRCIRSHAFASARSYESNSNESCQMELPDGLLVIESCALSLNLTDLYIPGSVQFIDSTAFADGIGLKNIRVDSDNDYYSDINGVLFNKDATALISYPIGKEEEDYTIPDSVKTVDYNAFIDSKVKYLYIGSNCDLGEIWTDPNLDLLNYSEEDYNHRYDRVVENTLPYPGIRNNLWSIQGIYVNNENNHYYSEDGVLFSKDGTILVWYPCRSERTHYIVPYGVKEIAPFAFYSPNGSKLTSVDFPDTLSIIGDCAYIGASEINIPDGVSKVGYNAFTALIGLQYIQLPSSLREVGDSPVAGKKVEIHYNGTVKDWNENVSVYKEEGTKSQPVIDNNQVICTDGIIK